MENLDLQITLRCNANCPNCIKFCNKEKITGLDYSDSDMTLEQVDRFVEQARTLKLNSINVTGGEPLLHPDIEEIIARLEKLNVKLQINSNRLIPPPPSLSRYVVNYSEPKDNHLLHNVVFLHPSELSDKVQTYEGCKHYRKNTVVLNYQGYSLCCAADGYIRLFGMEDLISDSFPKNPDMDKICRHCPFGCENLPLEKDLGCPVSDIYKREAEKNRSRKITKRFGAK